MLEPRNKLAVRLNKIVGEHGLNANDGVTSPFGFPRVCAISSVSFRLAKTITSLQHGHIYHCLLFGNPVKDSLEEAKKSCKAVFGIIKQGGCMLC